MLFYQAKTITKLQKENRYLRTEFSFNPYRARGDITLVYDAADQSVNIDIDRILRTAMDMRGFRDS